jgi:hypothetical protein
VLSPAGREQIAHCPLRIGIVSTGLMMRDSLESSTCWVCASVS